MRYQPTLVDNYQQTKERIAQIGRQYNFSEHAVIDDLHQLRAGLADFQANKSIYAPLLDTDIAGRAEKNLADLEKDLNRNIKKFLGNLHATGIAFARAYHATRKSGEPDESEEARKNGASFAQEYQAFVAKTNLNGYKTDAFLKMYAVIQAEICPDTAIQRTKQQHRTTQTLDEITNAENELKTGEEAVYRRIKAAKSALFWTYVPLAQWRLLNVITAEAKHEFAGAHEELRQLKDAFPVYEAEEKEMAERTRNMQQARKRLEEKTPSLEMAYITLLIEQAKQKKSVIYQGATIGIQRFVDAANTLREEKEKLKGVYETGIRAVDLMTRDTLRKLEKIDVAFTPEAYADYQNRLEQLRSIRQKRSMLGLSEIEGISRLESSLERNSGAVQRHLDQSVREKIEAEVGARYGVEIDALKKGADEQLTAMRRESEKATAERLAAKDAETRSILAAKEAEAQAAVAGKERELAEITKRHDTQVTAERRVREHTAGELSRAKQTLREQTQAVAALAAERGAEEARRREAEEKTRDAEEKARAAEQQAHDAQERARAREEESRRVAEEAEARAAAVREATSVVHEETVFSPAQAVVLGNGRISWL